MSVGVPGQKKCPVSRATTREVKPVNEAKSTDSVAQTSACSYGRADIWQPDADYEDNPTNENGDLSKTHNWAVPIRFALALSLKGNDNRTTVASFCFPKPIRTLSGAASHVPEEINNDNFQN